MIIKIHKNVSVPVACCTLLQDKFRLAHVSEQQMGDKSFPNVVYFLTHEQGNPRAGDGPGESAGAPALCVLPTDVARAAAGLRDQVRLRRCPFSNEERCTVAPYNKPLYCMATKLLGATPIASQN